MNVQNLRKSKTCANYIIVESRWERLLGFINTGVCKRMARAYYSGPRARTIMVSELRVVESGMILKFELGRKKLSK